MVPETKQDQNFPDGQNVLQQETLNTLTNSLKGVSGMETEIKISTLKSKSRVEVSFLQKNKKFKIRLIMNF